MALDTVRTGVVLIAFIGTLRVAIRQTQEERDMSRQTTKAAKLGVLQKFRDSLTANQANLPQLESSMAQFDTMVTNAHELTTRQDALTAAKQDVAKQFVDTLTEAERLGTVLRLAVKQHFG